MIEVLALLADLALDGAGIAVFVLFGFIARSWYYILSGAVRARAALRSEAQKRGLGGWVR